MILCRSAEGLHFVTSEYSYSSASSVVQDQPRSFPIKEMEGKGVCYSQDTATYRMEIEEAIRPILREFQEPDPHDGSVND